MSLTVTTVERASDELVVSLNQLLPQLSSTAPPLTLADLESLVAADSTTLFVAKNDGRIVGTLTLIMFPIPTGLRAWIEDVVVDHETRGLGVGEALTMAAVEVARQQNVRSIDLTSRPSRAAANALYKRLGFMERETNVFRLSLD